MGVPVVPKYTRILVIGGGPAGAYTACVLARGEEGFEVTVFEKDQFPRYHIGESMLPSFNAFMDFIGARQKVKDCGFIRKPGAAIKLNQYKREGYTNFIQFSLENSAVNLLRSEFDELLLKHAAECGARVFNGVAVNEIQFSATDKNLPISASWSSKSGQSGIISFDWLVDASGRNGIMSTKYLKTRVFNESFRNIATWGYWTGAGVYSPGTERENAPWFEALTDESGWAWFIPIRSGMVSVGVVVAEDSHRRKKAQTEVEPDGDRDSRYYLNQLKLAPGVTRLLSAATFNGTLRSAGDYSYSAKSNHYAGPHYRIAGDAGGKSSLLSIIILLLLNAGLAFIDPLFSSGVHLAFTGGLSAAATIAASIKKECNEQEAIAFHNAKVGTSYTRFLVVVWAVYKQIKSQMAPILSEIDEDNFDRAFDFLRPVIQGAAEIDHGLTQDELNDALEFCEHGVGPASPELFQKVSERIDPELLSPQARLLSKKEVDAIVGEDDEAKQVLRKHNSNKALGMIFDYQRTFRGEILNGMYVHLEKGELGLRTGLNNAGGPVTITGNNLKCLFFSFAQPTTLCEVATTFNLSIHRSQLCVWAGLSKRSFGISSGWSEFGGFEEPKNIPQFNMDHLPPTPVSPNSRPASGPSSPYTAYVRPSHHRKRISALRLSSDTTSTLPEYNPNSSVTPWRIVPQVTAIDDAPPGYSSDSAEEADEDTDLSDEGRRRQAHRSVVVTVGFNSGSPTTSALTSPPTPRSSRLKRGSSQRHKRSNFSVNLDHRSNSDLYLDSLLERSVHALEMSNALLQSSISTNTALSGILNQENDSEEDSRPVTHPTLIPSHSGPGSGIHSLERSARELSSRIIYNRNVHDTWADDLEQIGRDVDQLFSESAQGRTHARREGSGSSQGSISASLPTTSFPQSSRHDSLQGSSKRAIRRASLDFGSARVQSTQVNSQRHDETTGVPHLRYDLPDRERFISQPPRALTQYVVVEGDVDYRHEDGQTSHHPTLLTDPSRKLSGLETSNYGKDGRNVGPRRLLHQDLESAEEEAIALPSTLGLRSSGTHSTLWRKKQLSHSPSRTSATVSPSASKVDGDSPASSMSHISTRAPRAYNMLSSFVYPVSSSPTRSKRSNSVLSTSRGKEKMTSRPDVTAIESMSIRRGGSDVSRRRHSTSPAASTTSTKTSTSGSSTITAGSVSRSRSQTPKPVGSSSSNPSRKWDTAPPFNASGTGGGADCQGSSDQGDGDDSSSDSCPTKQTIRSLRKILDANPLAKHDDWTLISKPPRLLQQPLKISTPLEAGTSTATASISRLFTRGLHSHEGSVTRQGMGDQRTSSFKAKASTNNSAAPSMPVTPTTISPAPTPTAMKFSSSLPSLLSTGVSLALKASSPLSSRPSSGTSTPATPGNSKRISFAQLPEGTQGIGPERKSKRRKGKQKVSIDRAGNRHAQNGSSRPHKTVDDEGGERKGWLGWLIGVSGADSGHSEKADDRLSRGWGGMGPASRNPGYGGGFDEWGI
ncbi:hypothetical protein D9757_006309 [Collybiopsis confluens]|uniref:FAD/NAD(P)-binding domain-containing protein n=1 Tax=Collybiopsis confluens TaxID=2823264 RepID=A0A8H5HHC2_9AGAR|nr:hypothetical protein D9757_006309 [Collybiopsis confluens]